MKTYYLQMESSNALVPSVVEGLCLRIIDPPDGRVNQRFYREVGGRWDWADCAEWSAERWTNHLESNPISTIVLQIDEEESEYFASCLFVLQTETDLLLLFKDNNEN